MTEIWEMLRCLKRLFCIHDYVFDRYLHGDAIIAHNYKRYQYRCRKCGGYKWTDEPINKEDSMEE